MYYIYKYLYRERGFSFSRFAFIGHAPYLRSLATAALTASPPWLARTPVMLDYNEKPPPLTGMAPEAPHQIPTFKAHLPSFWRLDLTVMQ